MLVKTHEKGALTLKESVERCLENYFKHLDGYEPSEVYKMVLEEVESPLLAFIMKYADGNQCKAAELLGINRGTLRKKLKQYQLV